MGIQHVFILLSALQILQSRADMDLHHYQLDAARIIFYSLYGGGKDQSYNRLADFTDRFGPRHSGTQDLEDSIDHMLDAFVEDGLDNVHGEEVWVSNWVRNHEYARLVSPRAHNLAILGLGSSIGTGGAELTADAIVVRSFDELDEVADRVPGKIVVYNQDYVGYEATSVYRFSGAARAARYGAVATLIRSITDLSINTPHTGVQSYEVGVPRIPTACITVEDAEMLDRMQAREETITISLYMGAENNFPTISRNAVAEIRGSVYPEQVVIVSGHIDSWDVGQGAMDDGGGVFVSWQALTNIRRLGLTPKRTIRLVLWTDEENGAYGSRQYYENHKDESNYSNYSIVFESDLGVFTPYGVGFTGSAQAKHIMEQIGSLLTSINCSYVGDKGEQPDNAWFVASGVPVGTNLNHNERYFWFHHTDGDTMTVMDPGDMNLNSALFAVYAYVLGDIDQVLPRSQ